jgi:hypothetical protein
MHLRRKEIHEVKKSSRKPAIDRIQTLQRGGRVAREARQDGRPRTLNVFNFKAIVNDKGQEVEKTTKEILDGVALASINLTEKAKQKIQLLLSNTHSTTQQYFLAWNVDTVRNEAELLAASELIATQELNAIRDPSISDIVSLATQHAQLGLTLEYLDTIAQLYSDEPHGESVVLFENERVLRDLLVLYRNQYPEAHRELAKRRITIHQNLVASLINEGFSEQEVDVWTDRTLMRADNIA